MTVRRIFVLAVMVSCVSALALAQGQPQPTSNWTAPPFWSPPAAHHALGGVSAESVPVKTEAVPPSPIYPFTAVTPCRLIDTYHTPALDIPRTSSTGDLTGDDFAAGEIRVYDLTASSASCNTLPTAAGIVAWSLNFQYTTLHNGSPYNVPSFLTAWPFSSSDPWPPTTPPAGESTVLGYPDRWIANSTVIEAGNNANGMIDL
ncbi:MAG: hypothetical protein ACHQQS_14635, partial [Thermoanaerobaculales bacterium]